MVSEIYLTYLSKTVKSYIRGGASNSCISCKYFVPHSKHVKNSNITKGAVFNSVTCHDPENKSAPCADLNLQGFKRNMEEFPELARSMKFGVKNKVTGVITFDFAEKCRDDNNKCSETAIFYEKNNNE